MSTASSELHPTKVRILDAAEELFALRGYYGVSIREITQAAGVELALANYHFGPKEELFRQVIARRADEHCAGVLAALDQAQSAAPNGIASVEAIVRSFCSYTFQTTVTGGAGWKRYFQLLSRSAVSPVYDLVLDPFAKPYGTVVRRYVAALQSALPTLDAGDLYSGFYLLQAMVSRMLAETGLLERQSRGLVRTEAFDQHLERLVTFATAGFYALAARPPQSTSR